MKFFVYFFPIAIPFLSFLMRNIPTPRKSADIFKIYNGLILQGIMLNASSFFSYQQITGLNVISHLKPLMDGGIDYWVVIFLSFVLFTTTVFAETYFSQINVRTGSPKKNKFKTIAGNQVITHTFEYWIFIIIADLLAFGPSLYVISTCKP